MTDENITALTPRTQIIARLPEVFEKVRAGSDLSTIAGEIGFSVQMLTRVLYSDKDILMDWEAARTARGEYFVGQIVDICDRVQVDPEMNEKRAKVAIDALKWLAEKFAPKQFGKNTELTERKQTASNNLTVNILVGDEARGRQVTDIHHLDIEENGD